MEGWLGVDPESNMGFFWYSMDIHFNHRCKQLEDILEIIIPIL